MHRNSVRTMNEFWFFFSSETKEWIWSGVPGDWQGGSVTGHRCTRGGGTNQLRLQYPGGWQVRMLRSVLFLFLYKCNPHSHTRTIRHTHKKKPTKNKPKTKTKNNNKKQQQKTPPPPKKNKTQKETPTLSLWQFYRVVDKNSHCFWNLF